MAEDDQLPPAGSAGRNQPVSRYVRAPRTLKAFPDAVMVPRKTPRPGGGRRHRWKRPDDTILEWDYQHGKVEKYNWLGHHLGEFDPETGAQTKPPTNRRAQP